MGLLTVQLALALRNQMRAWLPARLARAGVDGLPTLACAAAGIVLLSTEYDAFLDLLAAVGALADPVVAGIFSGLVLIAATRRGQRAGRRRLWSAAIATAVGVVVVIAYAFGIIAHAAVIWETPLRRVLAGSVAIVCVLLVVEAVVAHRFRRLSHVELEAVAGAGRTWRLHLVNPAATRVFGADLELVDGSRFGTTQLPLRIETGASTNRLRLQLPDDGLRLRGEPETPERRATEIMIDPADRGEVVVEAVGAVARPSTAHLPTRAAPAPVVPESPE